MLTLTRIDSDLVWYAPDIQGNRRLPPAERFVVQISPMSRADMLRVEGRAASLTRAADDETATVAGRFSAAMDAVLLACVKRVSRVYY